MASRLKLHEEFCELLENRNVYFQPPESVKLKYPCIVYSLKGLDKRNANNALYKSMRRYQATVIDRDPDSEIPEKLLNNYQMCSLDNSFVKDNLNHFNLTLYY